MITNLHITEVNKSIQISLSFLFLPFTYNILIKIIFRENAVHEKLDYSSAKRFLLKNYFQSSEQDIAIRNKLIRYYCKFRHFLKKTIIK